MDLGAALLALLTAYLVKTAVLAFTGWLVLRVYQAAYGAPPRRPWLLLPAEDTKETRVLWWSLVLFAASELTCGVELYVLLRSSPWISGAHALVSAAGMGLFAVGMFMLVDRKVLRWSQPGCSLKKLCRTCTVQQAEGCKLSPLFSMTATFTALAALPPLFAPTARMVADTRRYMLPFPRLNAWYDAVAVPFLRSVYPPFDPKGAAFYLPESMLVLEWRVLPALSFLLCVGVLVLARRRAHVAAARLFAFAAGVLGYVYFELTVYRVTGDALLGSLAHEVAELWFLLAIAELLRRIYPNAPGPRAAADPLV